MKQIEEHAAIVLGNNMWDTMWKAYAKVIIEYSGDL